MDLPPVSDPCWTTALTSVPAPVCHSLAVQMLVFRLRRSAAEDPSPGNLSRACTELHAFFASQSHLPTVKLDLSELCGVRP